MESTQKGNNMESTQKGTMDLTSLVSGAAVELGMKKSEVKVQEAQANLDKLDIEETTTVQDTTVDNSSDGAIKDIVYQPLGYSGAKDKFIPQIARFLPQKIGTLFDLFGGSFSLGININADKVLYNEKDTNVFSIINGLSQGTPDGNLINALKSEKKYKLGKIDKKGKTEEEIKELSVELKSQHKKLKEDYAASNSRRWADFFIAVTYSWSARINYDTDGVFNSPAISYTHCFNPKLQNKFLDYSKKLISMGDKVEYANKSYEDYKDIDYQEDDVVYLDPPYSLTDTDYVRKWNKENGDEKLFDFIDNLDSRGVKFAMSNVFEMDGKTNKALKEWSKKYKVYYLDIAYKQSDKSKKIDPKTGEQAFPTVEVLITNYGEGCNSSDVAKMYKNDMNIVQGSFFIDDEVERGNESHRLADLAQDKFKVSFEEAIVHKCEELIQRINTGKSILLFEEKYKIQKRLDKKKGVKTQAYKEAIKSAYNFDYETGRTYRNLASDPRIAKLKVEDILKFERKSLDALKDMTFLTDEEFSLFLEGKHELERRRKEDKKRAKNRDNKNPLVEDEDTESNQNPESEKEFINPFPKLATSSEVKKLLSMEKEEVIELYLRYKLTSEASLPSSANNSYSDCIDVTKVA
jgi:DNA adenine methylase